MEKYTPAQVDMNEIVAGVIDGEEITTNLFKHTPIPSAPQDKLTAFLRIRPYSEVTSEKAFEVLSKKDLLTRPPKGSQALKNHSRDGELSLPKRFIFNHIFDPTTDQETFYRTCAVPLFVKFLKGDNVLFFAYGTTGSGKSFTMQGTPEQPGVIPRALTTLFACLEDRIEKKPCYRPSRFCEVDMLSTQQHVSFEIQLRDFIVKEVNRKPNSMGSVRTLSATGIQVDSFNEFLEESNLQETGNNKLRFLVWVSFFEFYNEQLYDLLAVETERGEKTQQLMLVPDANNNYFVKGLRHVFVSTAEEAYKALVFGQENLHVAETCLNRKSSRSHCNFNINLIVIDVSGPTKKLVRVSNLSFCDLAGSERSKKTQNTGERIKEAGRINGSLLSLSRCISALRHNQKSKNQMKIPFRDSKLTKFFQSFFNGTASAAMVININPTPSFFDETMVSLNFSAVASQVVVSNEATRRRFQDSLKRLTERWMQSTQRWSTFDIQGRNVNPSFSTIMGGSAIHPDPIDEEMVTDDEEDVTIEDCREIQEKMQKMTQMNFDEMDPQVLEMYRQNIVFLEERLKENENGKLELEMNIRAEVAKELKKITDQMTEDHAHDNEKAKKRMEGLMEKRLMILKRDHAQEMNKCRNRITSLEQELFAVQETNLKEQEVIKEKAENDLNLLKIKVEKLEEELQQKERDILTEHKKVEELKEALEKKEKNILVEQKKFEDMNILRASLLKKERECEGYKNSYHKEQELVEELKTREASLKDQLNCLPPVKECLDRAIETEEASLLDANTSTSGLITHNNTGTSPDTLVLVDKSTNSEVAKCVEQATGTSFVGTKTRRTSTSQLIQVKDTSMIADVDMVDVSIEPIIFDAKHVNTSTEGLSASSPTAEKSTEMQAIVNEDKSTSVVDDDYFKAIDRKKDEEQNKQMEAMKKYYERQLKESKVILGMKDEDIEKLQGELAEARKQSSEKAKHSIAASAGSGLVPSSQLSLSSSVSINESKIEPDMISSKSLTQSKKVTGFDSDFYLQVLAKSERDKPKAEKRPKDDPEEKKQDQDELGAACFSTEPKRSRRSKNQVPKSYKEEDESSSVRKRIPLKESRTESISPIREAEEPPAGSVRKSTRKRTTRKKINY